MKFKAFILTTFVFLLLLSCKNDPAANIAKLEGNLTESSANNEMQQLVDAYIAQVAANPDDANNNSALLGKAADLNVKMNKFPEATSQLLQAIKDYPDAGNKTDNLLALASVYRNNLAQTDPNGENYNSFKSLFGTDEKFKSETDILLKGLVAKMVNPTSKKIDSAVAMDYVNICEMYAGALPKDSKSADHLIKAGEMARNVNQYTRALSIYDWVIDKFPDSERASQALFFKGFTLDDNMNRKDEAKKYYEEFLKKYPNDDFADDTQFLLDNLGKSDEEIIKAFEEKQKSK